MNSPPMDLTASLHIHKHCPIRIIILRGGNFTHVLLSFTQSFRTLEPDQDHDDEEEFYRANNYNIIIIIDPFGGTAR